jgi:hypothetical protein
VLLRRTPAIRLEIRPDGLSLELPGNGQAGVQQTIGADGHGLSAALERALALSDRPAAASQVQVTLAPDFCWLDVVQGDFASMSDRVIGLIARGSLADSLGDAATPHELRWQVQSDGRHMVLLAVPAPFVQALLDAMAAHGLRAQGLQATALALWNWSTTHGAPASGVWAWARLGQVVMVRVRQGVITTISNEWVMGGGSELDLVLRRLLGRSGDELGPADHRFLLSDDAWSQDQLGTWKLQRIASTAVEALA